MDTFTLRIFLLTFCVVYGCTKPKGDSSQASGVTDVADQVGDPKEDMVGNWRVDLERSRISGVVADSNQTFSVAISPTGERLTYQGQVLIETGQFSLNSVSANGDVMGTFRPKDRDVATEVRVSFRGEDEMTWTFEGTERTEVLIRDVVPNDGDAPSEE